MPERALRDVVIVDGEVVAQCGFQFMSGSKACLPDQLGNAAIEARYKHKGVVGNGLVRRCRNRIGLGLGLGLRIVYLVSVECLGNFGWHQGSPQKAGRSKMGLFAAVGVNQMFYVVRHVE
jgi:hypothetical protein